MLDPASLAWYMAGSKKNKDQISWSWRYIAGCLLLLDSSNYIPGSPIKFTKQDRSEWRKLARLGNLVISRTYQRLGPAAYCVLDTLAGEIPHTSTMLRS